MDDNFKDLIKTLNKLFEPYKSITENPAFKALNQINIPPQIVALQNSPVYHASKLIRDLEAQKATIFATLQQPSTIVPVAISDMLQKQNDFLHRIQQFELLRHENLAMFKSWNVSLLNAYEVQQAHLDDPIPESLYHDLEETEIKQLVDIRKNQIITWEFLFAIVSFVISLKLSFDTTAQLNEIQDQLDSLENEQHYQTELLEENNRLLKENNMLLKSQYESSPLTEEQINQIIENVNLHVEERNLSEKDF